MVRHFIILSSSYSKGARIAYDICGEDLTFEFIESKIEKIKSECGKDVAFSLHFIDTESKRWRSVLDSDPFFNGVICIKSIDEFISLIKQDLQLQGIDIAQYISSKKEYTHLELQKLTYFCYADYLCATGRKLFEDKIYAFKYGPVVESVYIFYKNRAIKDYADTDEQDTEDQIESLPIRSKILFALNGIEKVKSIDNTVSKFANFSAGDLINISHRQGSPWSRTRQSCEIKDNDILNYHYIEEV